MLLVTLLICVAPGPARLLPTEICIAIFTHHFYRSSILRCRRTLMHNVVLTDSYECYMRCSRPGHTVETLPLVVDFLAMNIRLSACFRSVVSVELP